jgi:hypothetical protein
MNSIDEAASYVLDVAGVTLVQLFTLGGSLLILIAILSWLSGYVYILGRRALGPSVYHFAFGMLGSTIHEMGHAIASAIFGHRIRAFRPFVLNPNAPVLGYVGSEYRKDNLYHNVGLFFIGIAPILFGPLVIFLASYILFYDEIGSFLRTLVFDADRARSVVGHVLSSSVRFLGFLFSPAHLLDWRLYAFLYIAFAVGSSVRLSPPDIAGARTGCLLIVALLFMFNLVLLPMGVASETTFAWLSPYYTYFYVILVLVMLLNLLAALLLWLPASIRKPD